MSNGLTVSSGSLTIGTAKFYASGAVVGSDWEDWHPSGNAKLAIGAKIVEIATQIVNNALNAFKQNPQFTGTLKVTGEIKATGNVGAFTS